MRTPPAASRPFLSRTLQGAAALLLPIALATGTLAGQGPAPDPSASASGPDLLVQCRTLMIAPDTTVTPGELLVRNGKVAHVGREIPAEARSRAKTIAFAEATIVPGFVLAHTTLGRDGDLAERTAPMTPDLLAVDAFDPFLKELLALPRAAVTSCALSPSSANVAGGIAALVKPGAEMGRVGKDQCFAKFSLVAAARSPDRPPTALMGAVDMLREALRTTKGGGTVETAEAAFGSADRMGERAVFGSVLRGERRAFVHAETRAEILAALALGREFGFEPVLLGAGAACDVLDQIVQSRAAVALQPLQPAMRDDQLRLPQQLEARGVPFCFVGDPLALRASAALAVHYGVSRKQALAAITRTAAELCGIAESHGSLRRGCDADFAVFSGDPLDLGSRLHAVYVGGVRLVGDAPAAIAAPAAALSQKEAL